MEDKNYYQRTGYVSNSSLNYLKKSPKLFKKYLDGQIEEESKDYFRFGQLVHLRILEPKEFEDTVLVYDYETPRSTQQKVFIENFVGHSVDDNSYIKYYKKCYTTKESDEKILEKAKKLFKQFEGYYNYLRLKDVKTIISTKEFEKIKEMEANCRSHKSAKEILFDLPHPMSRDGEESYNEYEILWKYDSVPCKSLLDRHVLDYNKKIIKLVDFKTTAKLADFKESFYNYGYDRQLVFYTNALLFSLADTIGPDLENWTIEYYIVACDTITHETKSFKIEESDLEEAKLEIDELLNRAKWHMDNNKWDHSMEYYLGDGHEKLS
jgi:hypothetical protein